jgi:hypothetical protein
VELRTMKENRNLETETQRERLVRVLGFFVCLFVFKGECFTASISENTFQGLIIITK